MSASQEARLRRVLDDLRLLSPTAFVLGKEGDEGETVDLYGHGLLAPGAPPDPRVLASTLQGHLYNVAYLREWPTDEPPLDPSWTPPPPDPGFLARLRALRPEPKPDGGWRVRAVEPDGAAVLDKNGWTRRAAAGRWGSATDGVAWVEPPGIHPGPAGTFVFLHGRTPGDGTEQGNLFRVYFHTGPDCAADFLTALAGLLDEIELPFTCKTLMAPAAADRPDATVLYLSRRYHRVALDRLGDLPTALLDRLGPSTPLFALPLRPGVAVAEDPPTGESFGMHRLRLVVEAVLGLWRQGVVDGDARARAVADRFTREGLRLDAPHLGPGSTLTYPSAFGANGRSSSRPTIAEDLGDDLETAARIGARLCRDALWHEDRCTWQGWAMTEPEHGGEDRFVWRSLGPDYYRGTAGICWFLARLHAETGEPRLAATVAGGIAQALGSRDRVRPEVRVGFHTGLAGIGHAAVECGALLERPDWVDAGLGVLEETGEIEPEPQMFDVVSGVAGCIPVLLAAAARHERPRLLDIAVRQGEFLLEQARPLERGVGWGGGEGSVLPALAGFSHGAGGVSLALADLFAATGDERFLRTARAGLELERACYRPDARNWLDLRQPVDDAGATGAMAWCHGAPGIALSRLGWLEALPEGGDDSENENENEAVRAELEIALETTARHLSDRPMGNVSLCHGDFGNADVLLLAARFLERPHLVELARETGRQARRRVEARGLSWPSGNPGGHPTPGLMLGDAGAGAFYLRLHDPATIPSPLWARPGRGQS